MTMRLVNLSTGVLALSILLSFGMAYAVKAQDAGPAPSGPTMENHSSLGQDVAIPMNGIDVVCTGVGSSGDDPQWQSWPIRIVFSNGAGQFVAKVRVKLSAKGKELGEFACDAPWVLVRGPKGQYQVQASLGGQTKSASFALPTSSQKRVEIAFPGQ